MVPITPLRVVPIQRYRHLAAEITEIHPESNYEKLRIKVYVRQKDELLAEEEEQAKLSMRAVNMSDWEASELGEGLCPQGIRPLPLGRLSFRHAQPSRKRPTCCILQPSN